MAGRKPPELMTISQIVLAYQDPHSPRCPPTVFVSPADFAQADFLLRPVKERQRLISEAGGDWGELRERFRDANHSYYLNKEPEEILMEGAWHSDAASAKVLTRRGRRFKDRPDHHLATVKGLFDPESGYTTAECSCDREGWTTVKDEARRTEAICLHDAILLQAFYAQQAGLGIYPEAVGLRHCKKGEDRRAPFLPFIFTDGRMGAAALLARYVPKRRDGDGRKSVRTFYEINGGLLDMEAPWVNPEVIESMKSGIARIEVLKGTEEHPEEYGRIKSALERELAEEGYERRGWALIDGFPGENYEKRKPNGEIGLHSAIRIIDVCEGQPIIWYGEFLEKGRYVPPKARMTPELQMTDGMTAGNDSMTGRPVLYEVRPLKDGWLRKNGFPAGVI